MQFSSFTLVALMASFAYAQTIQQEMAKIPACGMTCLTTAATSVGCAATDFDCQCGTGREAITKSAVPCVVASCQPSDLALITQASTEICRLNALAGITGSSAIPSPTRISNIIATAVNSNSQSASGTATGTAARTSTTGNAASVVERFGTAGVAVGMGAVFAAFAL